MSVVERCCNNGQRAQPAEAEQQISDLVESAGESTVDHDSRRAAGGQERTPDGRPARDHDALAKANVDEGEQQDQVKPAQAARNRAD